MINQAELSLTPRGRGFHLITEDVKKKIGALPKTGLLNVFCPHTSCGVTLNENCDPSVRADLRNSFDKIVKENEPFYTHTAEGPDDMPAHIKSTLTGNSILIPITDAKLNLGTWQGIYLAEFRSSPKHRKLILTVYS